MGNYITLGLNIMLGIFIGFGVLWGFIRGMRKSLSRTIFLLITSLLLVLFITPLTNALLSIKFDVSIASNGEMELIGKYNLAEILEFYIKEFLGQELVTKQPELSKILIQIPVLFINSIIYLIVFWLLKYLLLPINVLINSMFPHKAPSTQLGFAHGFNQDEPTGAFITKTERESEEKKIEKTQLVYEEEPKKKKLSDENAIEAQQKADKILKELQDQNKLKKEEKKKQKKALKRKPFPNRLMEAILGFVTGCLITFNTMIPMYGFMDILDNANNLNIENLTDENLNLDYLTDGSTTELLQSYNDSIIGFVSNLTGIENIGLQTFDAITKQKINEKDVILREEVNAIIKSVEDVDNLVGKYKNYTKSGLENLTKAQLNDILSQSRQVITSCKQIQTVDILSNYALPVICSFLLTNEIEFSTNPKINTLTTDIFTTLIECKDINVANELLSIIEIFEYVNSQNVLLPIIQQNFDDPIALIKIPEESFGKKLVNKIFKVKTIDTTLTSIFSIGLEVFNTITNTDLIEHNIKKETIATEFSNIVNYAFLTAKTLDTNSPIYLTLKSFNPLGAFMDTARNSGFISVETYTTIVDYTTGKIRAITNSVLPKEILDVVNNDMLSNISKVRSWKDEMTQLTNAILILQDYNNGILGTPVESQDIREGFNLDIRITEGTLANLGKFMDEMEKTVIFGAPSSVQINNSGDYYSATPMTKLVSSMCDYAITLLNEEFDADDAMLEFSNVITNAKHNMIRASHKANPEIKFYQEEFTNIAPLVTFLFNEISNGELDISILLGQHLDQAKHSVLFGEETTTVFVSTALNIVKNEVLGKDYIYEENVNNHTINDKIYNLIDKTQLNLKSTNLVKTMLETSNFWETEFYILQDLKNLANDMQDLSSIEDISPLGASLDNIFKNNVAGPKTYLIPLDPIKDLISFSITDLKTDEPTGIEIQINSIFDKISNQIKEETFDNKDKDYNNYWQIEFKHLINLYNIEFTDGDDYSVKDNLTQIGFELDKVTLGYTTYKDKSIKLGILNNGETTTRASYLITHNMIRELSGSGVTEMKENITSGFTNTTIKNAIDNSLDSIANNLNDCTNIPLISFTDEFTHLSSLANLADISIDNDIFTSSSTEDLDKLDTLGKTLDSIAFNVSYASEYKYNDSVNSKIITRLILNTLIADITPMAKGTNDTINETVDSITDRINDLGNTTLLSWRKELGKVHDLVALNETTIVDFDASTLKTLGKNIDAISFNYSFKTDSQGNIIAEETHYFDGYSYYSTANYNSIIITREILKNTVEKFIAGAKPETTTDLFDDIVNDLIINTTKYINTTASVNTEDTMYNSFSPAFDHLTDIKQDVEDLQEQFSSVDLKTLEEETAIYVDSFLNTEQSKLVCGIKTTRKIAILILTKLQESMSIVDVIFSTTESGKYLNGLIETYTNKNITNNTYPESYYISSNTDYKMTTDNNNLTSDYSNISTINPIQTLRHNWISYIESLIP